MRCYTVRRNSVASSTGGRAVAAVTFGPNVRHARGAPSIHELPDPGRATVLRLSSPGLP